jgi:homoserine O-acetyltransferase
VPIATALAASAQQIAWWSTGRRIIRMDPRWSGGDYYDADPGEGPHESLSLARMVSQITFRSDDVFTRRFGREVVEPVEGFSLWQRFEVERYLEYHGDKLVRRFDANSYLLLTKAMDLHDLARGRGGMADALARLRCPVLVIGVASDILYPLYQSAEIVTQVRAAGVDAHLVELSGPHGHDAFLIEHEQVGAPLRAFLDDVESRDA